MKFAALALVGTVAAKARNTRRPETKRREAALQELVNVHYSPDTVNRFMELGGALMQNFQEAGDNFNREYPNFEHDMNELGDALEERYGEDLENW
jgi:hypothetical protein